MGDIVGRGLVVVEVEEEKVEGRWGALHPTFAKTLPWDYQLGNAVDFSIIAMWPGPGSFELACEEQDTLGKIF